MQELYKTAASDQCLLHAATCLRACAVSVNLHIDSMQQWPKWNGPADSGPLVIRFCNSLQVASVLSKMVKASGFQDPFCCSFELSRSDVGVQVSVLVQNPSIRLLKA